MSILTARNLAKSYGAQDVFSGIDISIARGDKIALVGPNGAGKTSLLRILLGTDEPTDGNVFRSRGLRMGYLPQDADYGSESTLYAEMLDVFGPLRAQERSLHRLADEMAVAADPRDLMERYASAEQRFELAGGYEFENRIKRVLSGLGFGEDTYEWPISVLSGGQVTRAMLARLLLEEPELLLLDEPTNYLDLEALEWLESYLQEWPHSLLVVSHDRYFLDKVVNRVWELKHGEMVAYRGNYSHFVRQRQDRLGRQTRDFNAQQALIAKTEDFIQRYHAGQRSREARGRQTRLDRIERIRAPRRDRHMSLRLSTTLRSGDNVLMTDGALIGYPQMPEDQSAETGEAGGAHVLFDTGKFLIQRGERVALLGANGSGTTTFLLTLLGQLQALSGSVRVGASVQIGYLPQIRDWLDPDKSVLEQILDTSDLLPAEARNVLGRFLFSGDDVFKQTSSLSGGELARLGLAVLTLRGANFLLLDEPTTHLDIESQEVLQQALSNFPGTILLVSHDRYLIDALVTHVWSIDGGKLMTFEGNYTQYLAEKERLAALRIADGGARQRARPRPGDSARAACRETRKRTERLQTLERGIEGIEMELDHVASLLDLATARQDAVRIGALGQEYQRLEESLSAHLHQWEQAASESQVATAGHSGD